MKGKILKRHIKTSSKKEFYQKHLELLNISVDKKYKLTQKEIDVLASFLSIPPELDKGDKFNLAARQKIRMDLKLSSGGLSNYIKSLINKKYIKKDKITKILTIQEFLELKNNIQIYQIITEDTSHIISQNVSE